MKRLAIEIDGIVQGVGFRPFVFRLASRLKLAGFVRNSSGQVQIEIEGANQAINEFVNDLTGKAPPLSRIERLTTRSKHITGETEFHIDASHDASNAGATSSGNIHVSPDVATCDECLADLFDQSNRRHLYPFVNCTNCGPRLTIVKGAPYDRARTTMAAFAMCDECRGEYENPFDRRFHAQPICCPKCGPQVKLLDADGNSIVSSDPFAWLANAINAGNITAIKGLGGYHLACDARNESVVAELRRRKHRNEKPFAIMASDLATAGELCDINATEATLLASPQRPILLLQKRKSPTLQIAESIAPNNQFLGIMLGYTPLHHLLLRAMNGAPLVMTSGNRADEPIAYQDADALRRLHGITDVFMVHNRPIHLRCDDSVTRVIDDIEQPIRRSRGYAPRPVSLPLACNIPTLALGGQLKSTFALGKDDRGFISHHLGDLDDLEAARAFERDISLYEQLFQIRPELIVHDLHPDYASTQYARRRAREDGIELLAVQHHHAHLASCMAEHALDEPVIGVTFDGTGLGTDGTIWGGEFLVGDYRSFERAAHLRIVAMPGADVAIRQPWRMAISHLIDAGCDEFNLAKSVDRTSIRTVRQMLERRFNSPMTSSAGRLFDAVAAIAGIRQMVSYEGQAAIELEQLAGHNSAEGSYPFEISDDHAMEIDTRPMIRAVASDMQRGQTPSTIARRFHSTLVTMISDVCQRIATQTGFRAVVLSGGVFLNALLSRETDRRLRDEGFRVYRHRLVPPNDGGLGLGQLAIAAATIKRPKCVEQKQTLNLEPTCVSLSPAR